jgi:hypothetical protein
MLPAATGPALLRMDAGNPLRLKQRFIVRSAQFKAQRTALTTVTPQQSEGWQERCCTSSKQRGPKIEQRRVVLPPTLQEADLAEAAHEKRTKTPTTLSRY